jgi:hypothetical protein
MAETRLARDQHSQRSHPHNLLLRACGLIVAPARTLASLQIAPRWFGALALAVALVSISSYLFAASDVGARLLVERRVSFSEAGGHHIPPADYAALIVREQHGALLGATLAGAVLVALTLIAAIGGFTVVSVLNATGALRAPMTPPVGFRQALSIATHAALIRGIGTAARLLLSLWIDSAGPVTSVGVLMPFLPEDTFWAHLGNTIDLVGLWWAHTLALGFAIVCLRRPDGLRLLFIGVYLAVAVALAALKTYAGAPSQ